MAENDEQKNIQPQTGVPLLYVENPRYRETVEQVRKGQRFPGAIKFRHRNPRLWSGETELASAVLIVSDCFRADAIAAAYEARGAHVELVELAGSGDSDDQAKTSTKSTRPKKASSKG